MSHHFRIRRAALLGLGALILASRGWSLAEEPQWRLVQQPGEKAVRLIQLVQQRGEGPREGARVSEYWIGLECYPVDATLRHHLGLQENIGLVVEHIVPESPADKAGFKQHDLITGVGDRSIDSVTALVEAIESSKGEEIEMKGLRNGKEFTLQVTPEKRPEDRRFPGRYLPEQDLGEVRRWIETLRRGDAPRDGLRYRLFGPGAMLPPGAAAPKLPKDVTISVTRSGSEPAKISVKRGDETWEVTEEKLDELPEDLRPHVERMLGRPFAFAPGVPGAPGAPRDELRGLPRPDGRMERQMQEMNEQLERLRKQFEEMQRSLPRQPKKGDGERA